MSERSPAKGLVGDCYGPPLAPEMIAWFFVSEIILHRGDFPYKKAGSTPTAPPGSGRLKLLSMSNCCGLRLPSLMEDKISTKTKDSRSIQSVSDIFPTYCDLSVETLPGEKTDEGYISSMFQH